MRVLFLTLYPASAGSPRYRVLQFIPYLESQGIDCTVASALSDAEFTSLTDPERHVRPFWYHAKELPRRLRQLLSVRNYDLVFLQKAIMTAYVRGFESLLSRAPRLVYDIDDAVHLAPPHPLRGLWRALENRNQIYRIARRADLILAGNEWLVSEFTHANPNATCFPTVVDTKRFIPARAPVERLRIGWIGNASTTPHVVPIAEQFADLENSSFNAVGADVTLLNHLRIFVQPWSLEHEVSAIQSFTVGVMPLPKTDWTRGKCALKALQYMACGIPCIATPHGAIRDIIRHNENGILADTPEEWRDAIERLRDPALRRTLGYAARDTVVEQFSLDRAAPRLRDILTSIP